MKKFFSILIAVVALSTPAWADFNYSYDTYSTDSGSLILNSLGDQVTNSTFGALGSNDFISENAFKNELALDGYTVAYDYNPQNTNPQFSYIYNVPPPTGVPLTELQFAGFEGNPRAIQDVYVPTSEYDALSAEGQASSISNLTTLESTDATNITSLQTGVSQLNTSVNGLTTQVNTNTSDINHLDNVTKHEERQIKREQGEITSVSNVANTAYNNTQVEQNEITTTNASVASQGQSIQSQQKQINGLNNRVHSLEETQGIIGGQLRVYDSRKIQINAFVDYDTTRSNVSEVGVRVTYKLGKSYEEQRIDELNQKLDELLGKKEAQQAQGHIKQYQVGNGVGIKEIYDF